MFPAMRYMTNLRQYAALESRMNQDFSASILHLSEIEVQRLVTEGAPVDEAMSFVNGILKQEVLRFPVQLDQATF